MKPQLPALVMPVSPASQAGQPLLARQPGQDLPAMRGDADCVDDTNRAFNGHSIVTDPYRNGTGGLRDSSNFNRRIFHTAPLVGTKKKRFG